MADTCPVTPYRRARNRNAWHFTNKLILRKGKTRLNESGSFRSYSRSVRTFRPGSFRPDFGGESFRPSVGGSFRPSFEGGSFRSDLKGESFRPDLLISGKQVRY